jgi:heme exporter protein CcmD
MNDESHLGFIIAAYAVGFIVIAGMIAAILIDQIALKRALSKLSSHRGESEE